MEFVLKALVNLSLSFDNEEKMAREGLLPVVQCMQRRDGRIQELACMTLANLALNDKIRAVIRECNGLPVVEMVFEQPASVDAHHQCCKLLTNLLINNRNRMYFQKRNIGGRMRQVMTMTHDGRMREVLSMALTNLAFPCEEEENVGPTNEMV